MLSVITFKYRKPTYRTQYTSDHVNALMRMTRTHYNHPHKFFCVTDDPDGLDPAVEYIPLWRDHFDLVNPSHPTSRPNCYPRLKLFSREARHIFGDRFVSLDLDLTMIGDMAELWHRPDDFVIYDAKGDDHYNGSMFLMTAGARERVWTDFDPVRSPATTTAAGMRGSDQAWIRYCLSPNAATWTNEHGVYAYLHIIPPSRERKTRPPSKWKLPRNGSLPDDAKMVIFAGEFKPWDRKARIMSPWVDTYYGK